MQPPGGAQPCPAPAQAFPSEQSAPSPFHPAAGRLPRPVICRLRRNCLCFVKLQRKRDFPFSFSLLLSLLRGHCLVQSLPSSLAHPQGSQLKPFSISLGSRDRNASLASTMGSRRAIVCFCSTSEQPCQEERPVSSVRKLRLSGRLAQCHPLQRDLCVASAVLFTVLRLLAARVPPIGALASELRALLCCEHLGGRLNVTLQCGSW